MTLYLIASAFFSDQKVAFFAKGVLRGFQEANPQFSTWQHPSQGEYRSSDADYARTTVFKAAQIRSDRLQLLALRAFHRDPLFGGQTVLEARMPAIQWRL